MRRTDIGADTRSRQRPARAFTVFVCAVVALLLAGCSGQRAEESMEFPRFVAWNPDRTSPQVAQSGGAAIHGTTALREALTGSTGDSKVVDSTEDAVAANLLLGAISDRIDYYDFARQMDPVSVGNPDTVNAADYRTALEQVYRESLFVPNQTPESGGLFAKRVQALMQVGQLRPNPGRVLLLEGSSHPSTDGSSSTVVEVGGERVRQRVIDVTLAGTPFVLTVRQVKNENSGALVWKIVGSKAA